MYVGEHARWLGQEGRLQQRRNAQARQWLVESLRERYGKEGLRRLGLPDLADGASPFSRLAELAEKLRPGASPW